MREVVSLIGAAGSGKSTKMRELIRPHARAVVICKPAQEERDSWRRIGFTQVDSLDQLSRLLNERWRTGFKLAMFPDIDLQAVALDSAAFLIWQYSNKVKVSSIALGCDEMAFCFSNAIAQTKAFRWFKTLLLDGRHLNISLYGASQRPQDVATMWRDEAARKFFFATHSSNARNSVLEDIGREYASKLPVKDYDFLEWNRGEISTGRTKR